jgi:hypothetical protein
MAREEKFTSMQLAVAGLFGTPIASAALLAINLRAKGVALSASSFAACTLVIVAADVFVGRTESKPLGLMVFLVLVAACLALNHLCVPWRDDSARRSWWEVVAVVFISFVLAMMLRFITT